MSYDKTEMNAFVQNLYDFKMAEGKHGHYESMFHVVHKAIERAALLSTPQPQPVPQGEREQLIADLKVGWRRIGDHSNGMELSRLDSLCQRAAALLESPAQPVGERVPLIFTDGMVLSALNATGDGPWGNDDYTAMRAALIAGTHGIGAAAQPADHIPDAGEMVQPGGAELAQYKRMFEAACVALGEINEALGLDPNDGGAEPILAAIQELRTAPQPDLAGINADLVAEILKGPCPVCHGIEGCDHPVPERLRAIRDFLSATQDVRDPMTAYNAVLVDHADRYCIEKTVGGFWPACIKVGDGMHAVFTGSRKQCEIINLALTTAFRDGAFLASNAAAKAQAGGA